MSVKVPYSQNEESGSIRLGLNSGIFAPFPSLVTWNGLQLVKKEEFHVTLLHAKYSTELAGVANDELAVFFDSFVIKNPIELISFIDDLRYVEEDDKKTILVRCAASNLEELFVAFNAPFGVQLPTQPAHVTLYSLDKAVGIHINSDEKMESLERVRLPELEASLSKIQKTALLFLSRG